MRSCSALVLVAALVLVPRPLVGQGGEFELPTWDDSQRWTRSAQLFQAALLGDILEKKEQGMTAEAIGRMAAETYGPPRGWGGSDTPFVLFRGMYYNWMSHPDQECELLEVSESRLVARCNRPYAEWVAAREEAYGVSVEEYEAVGLAFAAGIAAYHGMEWTQERDGDDLVVRVGGR